MKEFFPLGSEKPGEPTVVVGESEGSIALEYSLPGFFLVDGPRGMAGDAMPFKQVIMPSTGSLYERDKPHLPSLGRYLRIPPGREYEVSVETGGTVSHDSVRLWPSRMELAGETLYPNEIVQVTGPYIIAESRALLIHVTPFQYHPEGGRLFGYARVAVTLAPKSLHRMDQLTPEPHGAEPGRLASVGAACSCDADILRGYKPLPQGGDLRDNLGKRNLSRATGVAPVVQDALGSLFLNPGDRSQSESRCQSPWAASKRTEPEYLILHADPFKAAAEKLGCWKSSRGLLTEVVSINACGNSVEELKTYIRGRRAQEGSRLRYVLLLGDMDAIESEAIAQSAYGDNITDYYYSTEKDHDPAKPNSISVPWLAIGRIPARSLHEALGVVDKIIRYEKDPPEDPAYYNRIVLAAAFEDEPPHDFVDDKGYLETVEGIRSHLQLLGYIAEGVYVSNQTSRPLYYRRGDPVPDRVLDTVADLTTTTRMVVEATSEGRLIMCHRGHGVWNGWAGPDFRNPDLAKVVGNTPSVFYNISCETGRFDCGGECFAEKILKMDGAAPSLIAATRDSNEVLNNHLVAGLFDATFPGILPTFSTAPGSSISIRRLGDILNYAKFYLLAAVREGTNGPQYLKDHFEIYHVIGDPTLELWTKFPGTLTLQANLTKTVLKIQLSACPPGCVLTIWTQGTLMERIEPTSTTIDVPLSQLTTEPGTTPTDLRVCCWAPDYRYCEITP